MKNIFKTLAVAAAFFAASNMNAQNGDINESAMIGRARGAAAECLAPFQGSHDINGYVEESAICFHFGTMHRVTFYASPKCPPNTYCAQYVVEVATVDFDCYGNLIGATCNPTQK